MPRLIFVNRFFCPDHSATSQILSDLAFHLAGAGRDVHVVTSTQLYDDAKAALPVSEIIEWCACASRPIDRVWTQRIGWPFYRLCLVLSVDVAVPGRTGPTG